MRERQPFKALLERDYKTLHALGKQAVQERLPRPMPG